jgi:hypothetical protein
MVAIGQSTNPAFRIYETKEVRIVSIASVQAAEEGGQVPRDRRWFLNRGEVSAARKDCPALDVV